MLAEWECKKRWKCPTDRDLALRAKLNAGWSIHSANVFQKIEVIPLSELETIEKVIQRANDLEKMEVERVGRMVCKLENMTRNVLGDGEKTCSMCGTAFGIFRSAFVHCVDCNKAVCDKCSVDTLTSSLDLCMLCKICSENREVWKKSGGWFYGKFPTVTQDIYVKCEAQLSGSPSSARAFGTWEHRTPVVRLQSYQPPDENRNDHSLYKDWTMTTQVSDINCSESIQIPEKKQNDNSKHKDRIMTSIPSDLHSLEDCDNPPFAKMKSCKKRSQEPSQSDSNYLSVQSAKLSTSCPSLTDLKLRRKPSIRRKRSSTPAQKISKTVL